MLTLGSCCIKTHGIQKYNQCELCDKYRQFIRLNVHGYFICGDCSRKSYEKCTTCVKIHEHKYRNNKCDDCIKGYCIDCDVFIDDDTHYKRCDECEKDKVLRCIKCKYLFLSKKNANICNNCLTRSEKRKRKLINKLPPTIYYYESDDESGSNDEEEEGEVSKSSKHPRKSFKQL